MNEVLAMVVMAFFAERLHTTQNFDIMSSEEIASNNDDLINFIFDYRHTFADIYTTTD
jgi:hypothetical protein